MENTHLHILPSMNPDGFALRRRGNANSVDLNRDFPDQVHTRCINFPYGRFFNPLCTLPFSLSCSIYIVFFYWQFFPNNDDIKHRQPETRAIMKWIKQEHFTASASLHGVIILPLTLFVKLFD